MADDSLFPLWKVIEVQESITLMAAPLIKDVLLHLEIELNESWDSHSLEAMSPTPMVTSSTSIHMGPRLGRLPALVSVIIIN